MAAINEAAEPLGISRQAFQDVLLDGTIQRRTKAAYDLNECRKVHIARLGETAAGRDTSDVLSLTDERAAIRGLGLPARQRGRAGGWTFVARISLTTLQATGMGFFGLCGSTAAPATTLTPGTVINCIGIGFQRGTHTRWQLVANDGPAHRP